MSKSKMLRVLATWAMLMFFASFSFAQGVVQNVGNNGAVDWGSQVLRATGVAGVNPDLPPGAQRASALRAAQLTALRNLLEVAQGVTLNSTTTVRNAMLESDVINSKVEGVIRQFTIVDTRYMSDQSIEVEVEVPLTGVFSDAVLPADFGNREPGMATPVPGNEPNASVFTGLIINAKGLGVAPAMAPKILDENGNEVYGSRFVSREWAVKQGMVGYSKDLTQARNNDRVTKNPLVINALKADGATKSDIVVSNADAAKIQQAAQYQNFLDNCRVMFVVD